MPWPIDSEYGQNSDYCLLSSVCGGLNFTWCSHNENADSICRKEKCPMRKNQVATLNAEEDNVRI